MAGNGVGMDRTELEDLVRRIFHPAQPQLSAARAAVTGIEDGPAAWNRLAAHGLIPPRLFEDERRRFLMTKEYVQAALARGVPPIAPDERFPLTVRTALTLAADPQGILSAESCANELFARLKPWGAPGISEIRWLCVDKPKLDTLSLSVALDAAMDAVATSLEEQDISLDSLQEIPLEMPLPRFVRKSVRALAGWRYAAHAGFEVSGASWPPSRVREQPFAKLPNPFEPLIALWRTGYSIETDKEDVIKMLARQVDPPLE